MAWLRRLAGNILERLGLRCVARRKPLSERRFTVFGAFEDSRGNVFQLLHGYRDVIKPGWRAMFDPGAAERPPVAAMVRSRVTEARRSVRHMAHVLSLVSFDLRGARALEVGCYDGARSHALAMMGCASVTGSDVVAYYIHQRPGVALAAESIVRQNRQLTDLRKTYGAAMGSGARVTFVEDSIIDSKLPEESFDVICSWEVLEHVQSPKAMFREMHRLLRSGGVMFHEYNPFFALTGGHSLCTLDFPWGHVRLDGQDFERYIKTYRPGEAEVALAFYHYNLNRMTIENLRSFAGQAGFEILCLVPEPASDHLDHLEADILQQGKAIFPSLSLVDLMSPTVWTVFRKE